MTTITKEIKRARVRGVPLIALTTPDQPAAVRLVIAAANGSSPVISWDCVRGPVAQNELGDDALSDLLRAAGGMSPSEITDFPTMSLLCLAALPNRGIVVVHNAHKITDGASEQSAQGVQSIINLRDPFGSSGRTLIMMCPSWSSPPELGSDVLVVDDPLPTDDERSKLIRELLEQASSKGARIDDLDLAVETSTRSTRGLSRYAIDQTVSLSLSKSGLQKRELSRRFVEAINSTTGLTFSPDVVPLESIGGLENVKAFARALAGSRNKPNAIVFIDEIEKAVAGSSGSAADSSGASQAILGTLLTWMQEEGASGLIALGPPGAGKSMSAKAFGGVCDVPTIFFDLSALKGSLVGSTEQNVRNALKTIKELAGNVFFVATCNNETSLPPELRRRYKQGVWFFDLPSLEERASIWKLYLNKYELDPTQIKPQDEGWTGAEIAACCESAWSFGISLLEASQWIVPVAKSAAEQIESLRQNASGRYISASYAGAYQFNKITAQAPSVTGRQFSFEDDEEGEN